VRIIVSNAICLHAQADDLKFLNPVRNRMEKLLCKQFRSFSFGDQKSEADARLGLTQAQAGFVVILAHGSNTYLRGGEYVNRITREHIEGEKFMTINDAHYFAGKAVFCLSCDSNGLAAASLKAGAKAFVGFDDIPFRRYDERGSIISNNEFEHHAQELLAGAIKAALERFVTGRSSLEEAVAFLRLYICQQVVRFVRDMRSFKQRAEVAALLLRIKNGVRYHGKSDMIFAK
jgi:hypothetical protein